MAYQIRRASLPVLPPGHASLRVLHFSDLHLTPARRREFADIRSWGALSPDLVVSTGDFLAHQKAVPFALDALSPLLDLPGVFVLGSNDYYAPKLKNPLGYLMPDKGHRKLGTELPTQDLIDGLSAKGWINLNEAKVLKRIGDTLIEFRGTDDAHLARDQYELVAGKPDPKADLAVAVTHAPYLRLLEAFNADLIDLIFAGHTHGGQVRLPWPGGSKALTTNCDLPTDRARGVSKPKDQPYLNVSAGMGTSPFARIRVACPPEVSLITLEPAL
jgi:predicted MPP superfamily phosphohydrolase